MLLGRSPSYWCPPFRRDQLICAPLPLADVGTHATSVMIVSNSKKRSWKRCTSIYILPRRKPTSSVKQLTKLLIDELHPAPLDVFMQRLCARMLPLFPACGLGKMCCPCIGPCASSSLVPSTTSTLSHPSMNLCLPPIPPLVWDAKLTDC